MAKETKVGKVTFYLMRLDGEMNIRETKITYPFAEKILGRTKDEDRVDQSLDVTFDNGSLTLDADDFRVEWLKAYTSG